MFQIFLSEHFGKQIKGLLKKGPDLLEAVVAALKDFNQETAVSLGARTYKIRVTSKRIGRGKRGAYRTIVLLLEDHSLITPLTVYSKSDRETISRQEIMYHAAMVKRELTFLQL